MEKTKRNKFIVCWVVLSMIMTGLFFGIWYLINGSVPVVECIKITEDWTLQLPFAISRWTDVLFMSILVSAIIFAFTFESKKIDKVDYVAGLILGIVVGIITGLDAGTSGGIYGCIGIGIVVGFGAGIGVGISVCISVCIGVCIGAGIIAGISVGIFAGTITIIIALLKFIFSGKTCWKIGKWLIGK